MLDVSYTQPSAYMSGALIMHRVHALRLLKGRRNKPLILRGVNDVCGAMKTTGGEVMSTVFGHKPSGPKNTSVFLILTNLDNEKFR